MTDEEFRTWLIGSLREFRDSIKDFAEEVRQHANCQIPCRHSRVLTDEEFDVAHR